MGLDSACGVGSWIWAKEAFDKQTCRFWRSFEIPESATVTKACLRITVDNGYRLFLDGREVGRGSDWRTLSEYDVTWLLGPGTHVLAVEAFNDRLQGGLILGLRVKLVDGQVMEVGSDSSWRIVPSDERGWEKKRRASAHWPAAMVVGALGSAPWWQAPLAIVTVSALHPLTLHFWQTGWFQITLLSVCGVVGLICLRLTAQLAMQSKGQRLLQRERARIARDIHDDLGAGMTQLVLLGELAQHELPSDSPTRMQIDRLCDKARDLLGAMDEVIWLVNSRRDTLRDFAIYVCQYAQGYLKSTPIRCRLDVEPEMPAVPFDLPIRRNLFLAVKEALNNAAKYSEASELFLRIHRQDQAAVVVVEDNGKGFDPARANPERHGLTNLAQRMNEVGGDCRVISQPGAGCRIEFRIPLAHKHPRRLHWLNWHLGRVSVPNPVEQPPTIL
jgi:signal transduction histidine kinase